GAPAYPSAPAWSGGKWFDGSGRRPLRAPNSPASMSSSDRPRVSTPNTSTTHAPATSTAVVMPNTPRKPANGYTTPTRIGALTEPIRPNDDELPVPVVRTAVGKISGVYA